ncbi:hypothetical protein WSS_A38001 [Rhodococcus opacus M213]|uniref:Mycothiol-dependent maleylpyruvate isomerase metal-binding domain-containing protein n=1 Tax=Rhodococcus opacus M213 TaxID=1129896 RepID=K8X7B8_RHOOP|nr:maleylpyruvate isomerase family mycothiol-dependent enzyme [Rhodococcus opacus]EKT77363.1 hypothetical protein WSS_A38001 [Rhodococcus opacus M213]
MQSTTTPRAGTALRRPQLDHRTATRLAATEYDRFAELLESLTPEQWSRQTDCPAWDVRQLACHVLGMAAYASSIREGRRQQRLAHKALATHGAGEFIDQLTDLQVRERAALTPAQITKQFHAIGRSAAKGRRRTPAIIRRHRMPEPQTIAGISEWWTIGFVTDVILTRDVWMHRVDLSRAIGRPLRLSAEHDGELIADWHASGRGATDNRSGCTSPVPSGARGRRAPTAKPSNSTPSSSAASSPGGNPETGCSQPRCPSRAAPHEIVITSDTTPNLTRHQRSQRSTRLEDQLVLVGEKPWVSARPPDGGSGPRREGGRRRLSE